MNTGCYVLGKLRRDQWGPEAEDRVLKILPAVLVLRGGLKRGMFPEGQQDSASGIGKSAGV